MSFENMNAENRNNEFPFPEIFRQVARRTPLRCCSFCRRTDHNITRCDDTRLLEFEVICATEATHTDSINNFKIWLTQNYIENQLLLKSFAIRKCGASTRSSITYCITKISEYVMAEYSREPLNNELNQYAVFMLEFTNFVDAVSNPNGIPRNITGLEIMAAMILLRNNTNGINNTNNINRKLDILLILEEIIAVDNVEVIKCGICWDEHSTREFVKLNCKHEFCKDCIIKSLQNDSNCCAFCRNEIKTIVTRTQEIQTEITNLIA